ncbi:MAG: DUF3822 family protein [Bacteroidales bacterium]|nr:DUF3822 family protein [Bacteroidales bacterium]
MTTNDVKQISIRLQPDGFSYADKFYPVMPGADFNQRMEDAIWNTRLTELDAEIRCSVETTRFSLSPADIDESVALKMYHLSLPEAEGEETVLSQTDASHGIRIHFGIDSRLYHFLMRNVENIAFTHPLMRLQQQWSDRTEVTEDCMVAEAETNALNLLVYENGKLQMANRFDVTGTNNQTYHIMNCWTLFNLDILDNKLYLQTSSDELRKSLSQYLKQCVS